MNNTNTLSSVWRFMYQSEMSLQNKMVTVGVSNNIQACFNPERASVFLNGTCNSFGSKACNGLFRINYRNVKNENKHLYSSNKFRYMFFLKKKKQCSFGRKAS